MRKRQPANTPTSATKSARSRSQRMSACLSAIGGMSGTVTSGTNPSLLTPNGPSCARCCCTREGVDSCSSLRSWLDPICENRSRADSAIDQTVAEGRKHKRPVKPRLQPCGDPVRLLAMKPGRVVPGIILPSFGARARAAFQLRFAAHRVAGGNPASRQEGADRLPCVSSAGPWPQSGQWRKHVSSGAAR
jgi:hypothetical protein